MKKMIVVGFAIAMAFVANAASLNWSLGGGTLSPSPDGSALNNRCSYYTLLLFTADKASEVDAMIAEGRFSDLASLAVASSVASKTGAFSGTLNDLTGASETVFAIIFDTYSQTETIADASYYYRTGMVTQDTYDPFGTDPATIAGFTSAQMTGSWMPTADVPEPTSGILFILGMAGLALRRRRV